MRFRDPVPPRQYGFLIEGVTRIAEPEPDPTESIEVVLLSRSEVESALAAGTIDHALAVVSLERALYVPYHPDPGRTLEQRTSPDE